MREEHAEARLAMSVAVCSPELTRLLAIHIEDNDQVLPHVYFGDVSFHLIDLAVRARERPTEAADILRELKAVLDRLEESYATGTEGERELISVSFLENLPEPDESGGEIRDMLGPHLKRQLNVIDTWTPPEL